MKEERLKASETFAENVFTDAELKKRLTDESYKAYKNCIENNVPLERPLADEIAKAMKEWAIARGATHYTHWFQPMTGVTAEKHEAFIEPTSDGGVAECFSGKNLIKGEPDASSFPNGGLRATFEARGYTSYDPNSHAFVMNGSLYVPTVFCSYGGESLDKKAPLLRSLETLNKNALRVLRLLGDETTSKVTANVGVEQEYFLIDKKEYEKRLDLVTCGRTLFGAKPPKGQELEDHYFGKIKSRVWDYMSDLDEELWKLGVFAKTKHNEVAPAQHELANVYTEANLAADQNQITMSVMKSVANKHGMVCLLNEKPFAGINGSGKHNNWSLCTDKGENLFKPGKHPAENIKFLTFFAAVVAAVDDYQDMLRVSVASPGNDNRLGGNEAPPAIISMFVGSAMQEVIMSLVNGNRYTEKVAAKSRVGGNIAYTKDDTDRNRTSPFAFTGNKFEFRMVGSDMSVAGANIVLNTIVAEELGKIADEIEKRGYKSINDILKETFKAHLRIIFNGNNYSDEWKKEAAKRGLKNYPTTVDALEAYLDEKNISLFDRHGVFTGTELKSRYEIMLDRYVKTLDIEAKTMLVIAKKQILPAVFGFEKDLAKEITLKRGLADVCPELSANKELGLLKNVSAGADEAFAAAEKLESDLVKADEISGGYERAVFHKNEIKNDMEALRSVCDKLETEVADSSWPFPAYVDILNSVKY